MIVAVAIYLAVGTVIALDAGRGLRGEAAAFAWWADLAGFLVVAICWFPVVLWAVARQSR